MRLRKKKDQNVDALVLLRRENKTLRGGNTRSNIGAGIEEKNHLEAASPWDLPHMHPPKPSIIADLKKCLLAGTRYECLLRGSARVIQIQVRMLSSNLQTEHRDLNERARERTKGAGKVYNLMGRITISTHTTLQYSYRINNNY